MSKPHHIRWATFLLLCAAGIAVLFAAARTAAGDDPHISYLPAIVRNGPPYAYRLQPGSPTYLSNFINTSGCNWFGMVGRAFWTDNNPVINLSVHLEGGGLNVDVVTGSGPMALGPGGYEIPISDHPIETTGVYFIQLRSSVGVALSTVFMIPTHAQCSMNMVMVNFAPAPLPPTPTICLPCVNSGVDKYAYATHAP